MAKTLSRPLGKVAAAALLCLCAWPACGPYAQSSLYRSVCLENACISVEVADTPKARMRGLMGREPLERDKGMLFIFDEPGIYGFWMKNMKFPIDIIWIGEDSRVVEVLADAQPCADACPSASSAAPAKYVLEAAPGFAREHGISVGSMAVIH